MVMPALQLGPTMPPRDLDLPPQPETVPDLLQVGEIELWSLRHQARLRGRSLCLTPRQFEVLFVLVSRADEIVSSAEIYELVLGRPKSDPKQRDIAKHVRDIRLKLRDVVPRRNYIHTHHGLGYRYEPALPSASPTGRKP
jgi:DNA-binding response OmpR family regulator